MLLTLFGVLLVGANFVISLLIFDVYALFIPMTAPMIGAAATLFAVNALRVIQSDTEKRHIRGIFEKIMSPQLVKNLLDHKEELKLGGKRNKVTVLFCDIRNFTSMAEQMKPEELIDSLNHHLGELSKIVLEHNGTMDKYIGDCIMAFWGAPLSDQEQADHAVNTAIDIQRAVSARKDTAHPEAYRIQVGTGISTGDAISGYVGSEKFMSYTVIGDTVNLASRLEKLSGHARILINQEAFENLRKKFNSRQIDSVSVKGKKEPLSVYEILWDADSNPHIEKRD